MENATKASGAQNLALINSDTWMVVGAVSREPVSAWFTGKEQGIRPGTRNVQTTMKFYTREAFRAGEHFGLLVEERIQHRQI